MERIKKTRPDRCVFFLPNGRYVRGKKRKKKNFFDFGSDWNHGLLNL